VGEFLEDMKFWFALFVLIFVLGLSIDDTFLIKISAVCLLMTAISASIYSNKKNKRDTTETLGESPWLPQWEDKSYNPNLDDIQVIERTYTHWDWRLLNKLEWKRFEEVVSDYYRLIGYRSKVTRMGADGGVDVLLFQDDSETPVKLIQCKSWSKKVGVNAVRELYGVMAADGVSDGIFATTSSYTNEAREWVNGKNMELLSGNDLVSMFNALSEVQLKSHLANGLDGDYSTPTCPNCNQRMVSRTATKGKSAGSSFWGCANYPRCKQTFKMV